MAMCLSWCIDNNLAISKMIGFHASSASFERTIICTESQVESQQLGDPFIFTPEYLILDPYIYSERSIFTQMHLPDDVTEGQHFGVVSFCWALPPWCSHCLLPVIAAFRWSSHDINRYQRWVHKYPIPKALMFSRETSTFFPYQDLYGEIHSIYT